MVVSVVGKTETIFDTGTTQIIGDPVGIAALFAALSPSGAKPAPEYGVGIYTSTWATVVVLQISRRPPTDFSITVPCDFGTPISVYVGGKEVKIPPASFNLGPVSEDDDETCLAGAASDEELTGGVLAFGSNLPLGQS